MSKKHQLNSGKDASDSSLKTSRNSFKKKDSSPCISQRDKVNFFFNLKALPWTDNQNKILDLAQQKETKCIILDGPPGSAKTILAVYTILHLIREKKLSDLIYIRSLIQASDGETGFLQGDLSEKTAPFNVPLFDKLSELLSEDDIRKLNKDKRISTYPTSMLRGYNFNVKGAILDEAQNASLSSLLTVLTRMGEFSKVFICGDSSGQNDFGSKSGFTKLIKLFDDEESRANGIHYIKLSVDDIKRSGFVKFIVRKLQENNIQY